MGQKHKVLVVDDEVKIQALIRDVLVDEYEVLVAGSGEEGVQLARENQPDLIIMDALMPKMDGLMASKFIRKSASTKNIPIIMLTALRSTADRVNFFKSGVDDFITKPFDPEELLTRVGAKIDRFKNLQKSNPSTIIEMGNLRLNKLTRQIWVDDVQVYLTLIEFDLLKSLLEAEGNLRSRVELVESIWEDAELPIRVLDSHILSIRRKLRNFDHKIETVYGRGYVIRRESKEDSKPSWREGESKSTEVSQDI